MRGLRRAGRVVGPETILASNTSSLSVTEIGVHTGRPGKVVGLHFFNPAPVQRLVEVVRTVVTEPDVVTDVVAFAGMLGKEPVVIGDRAGFIANALLFGYLNHAVSMYESRYATREDLDAAMRFGCGYPMGPLALLDLIGLDTAYEILETMYRQSRNRLHAPAPMLKQMITAGLLGRKSGRGFYTYDGADSPTVVADAQTPADAADGACRRARCTGSASSAPGRWPPASWKCSRKQRFRRRAAGPQRGQGAGVGEPGAQVAGQAVVKGRLAEADRDAILGRIAPVVEFEELADCDLVVEAVAEELPVKQAVFGALDEVVQAGRGPGDDHVVAAGDRVRARRRHGPRT